MGLCSRPGTRAAVFLTLRLVVRFNCGRGGAVQAGTLSPQRAERCLLLKDLGQLLDLIAEDLTLGVQLGEHRLQRSPPTLDVIIIVASIGFTM